MSLLEICHWDDNRNSNLGLASARQSSSQTKRPPTGGRYRSFVERIQPPSMRPISSSLCSMARYFAPSIDRCTKKRGKCGGAYLREEVLDVELSNLLVRFHLPREWAEEMERMAEADAKDASESAAASVQAMRAKIAEIDGKVARLTDLFVEQDIERNAAHWLESLCQWISEAQNMEKIAAAEDLPLKNPPSKKSSTRTSPSTRAKRAARPNRTGFLCPPPRKASAEISQFRLW